MVFGLFLYKKVGKRERSMAAKKNWIKGAIKKPGSLTATAKKAGAVTKEGTNSINSSLSL